jgi:hypothetical protein
MGSPAVAAWIAQATFWGVLLWGYVCGELSLRRVAVFLGLWLAGIVALPYASYGAALFSPYLATLDIVLVFVVFKGDVKLT